jgi:hypothetical protein
MLGNHKNAAAGNAAIISQRESPLMALASFRCAAKFVRYWAKADKGGF